MASKPVGETHRMKEEQRNIKFMEEIEEERQKAIEFEKKNARWKQALPPPPYDPAPIQKIGTSHRHGEYEFDSASNGDYIFSYVFKGGETERDGYDISRDWPERTGTITISKADFGGGLDNCIKDQLRNEFIKEAWDEPVYKDKKITCAVTIESKHPRNAAGYQNAIGAQYSFKADVEVSTETLLSSGNPNAESVENFDPQMLIGDGTFQHEFYENPAVKSNGLIIKYHYEFDVQSKLRLGQRQFVDGRFHVNGAGRNTMQSVEKEDIKAKLESAMWRETQAYTRLEDIAYCEVQIDCDSGRCSAAQHKFTNRCVQLPTPRTRTVPEPWKLVGAGTFWISVKKIGTGKELWSGKQWHFEFEYRMNKDPKSHMQSSGGFTGAFNIKEDHMSEVMENAAIKDALETEMLQGTRKWTKTTLESCLVQFHCITEPCSEGKHRFINFCHAPSTESRYVPPSNPEPITWILYVAPMMCLLVWILFVWKFFRSIQQFFSKCVKKIDPTKLLKTPMAPQVPPPPNGNHTIRVVQ